MTNTNSESFTLDAIREPAAIVAPDLSVLRRNEAARTHPALGCNQPFANLPSAQQEEIRASLAAGRGLRVRTEKAERAADPIDIRLFPLGSEALAVVARDHGLSERQSFAEEQLGALIATAVDGIICIDAQAHVELFNPACERIFGFAAGEVLGRNIKMLMPPIYADHHDQYVHSYMDTGVKKIIGIGREVEGRRKNGEVFPMDLSVGEFRHRGQRRFVGIIRDLSTRVASERRLQDLRDQVAHMGRVSAVAEMGSALAHELNQPLTAMTLYLTAAERAIDSDPAKALDLFRRSKAEAARAGEIVRSIRQMVERSDHELATFDLSETLAASIDLCRVADPELSCAIEVDGLPTNFLLFGDATQIQQVLINLIKNALDATESQQQRRILITARRSDMLELFVEDDGPGVSPDIRERLFTAFTSTKPKGLGIGLSICRNIIEAHGGALDIRDQGPGRLGGACFRIRLPLETVGND